MVEIPIVFRDGGARVCASALRQDQDSRVQATCASNGGLSRLLWSVLLLVLCAMDAAAQGGYSGPSLLSRGGNRPGRRGRAPVDFNFYVGARGTAETGLLRPSLSDEGDFAPVTAYGTSIEGGVYGGHEWQRSSIGIDYRGDYRWNNRLSYFNGTNHALSLQYSKQMGRRTTIAFGETGGTSNRAFAGFAAPALSDFGQPGLPLNELFDVRTYYSQTSAAVAHRKSARLTLTGQGEAFFIKRKSVALINGQGYGASGYMDYRLTARTEAGIGYQFLRFEFPHAFAGSDIHSVIIRLRRRFTRNWDLDGELGAYRIDSHANQVVQLSPEVAFILGRSTGIAAFQRVLYRPRLGATLAYIQDRGRFSVSVMSGVSGGNGIYMTTYRNAVRGGYTYSGIRRTSIGLSAGYSRTSSATVQLRSFNMAQVGTGLTYRLVRDLHFSSQLDYRTFSGEAIRGRKGFAAVVGLSYSPSQFPLSIW